MCMWSIPKEIALSPRSIPKKIALSQGGLGKPRASSGEYISAAANRHRLVWHRRHHHQTSEDIGKWRHLQQTDRIRLRAVPADNRGCLPSGRYHVPKSCRSDLDNATCPSQLHSLLFPQGRYDRSVPCGTCIRRGNPEAYNRELVIIRGEVTTYRDSPQLPTYDELKNENERLRHEIKVIKAERIGARPNLSPPGKSGQDTIQALC